MRDKQWSATGGAGGGVLMLLADVKRGGFIPGLVLAGPEGVTPESRAPLGASHFGWGTAKSHCHTVTLSHCHRAPLGSSHYGRGSALHCGETRWVTWSLGTRAPTIQLLSLWFLCPCAYIHYIHCHISTLYWDAAIPESHHLIQEPTASMIRWSYEAAVVGCQKSRKTTETTERTDDQIDRQTQTKTDMSVVCRQMTPADKAIPVFIMARCVVSVCVQLSIQPPPGEAHIYWFNWLTLTVDHCTVVFTLDQEQHCLLRIEGVHVGFSNCNNVNFWLCLVVQVWERSWAKDYDPNLGVKWFLSFVTNKYIYHIILTLRVVLGSHSFISSRIEHLLKLFPGAQCDRHTMSQCDRHTNINHWYLQMSFSENLWGRCPYRGNCIVY